MVTSDMLLHLIADLQGDLTVTHGRRTLLKYAQTTSGARLALLFVFHKEHQTLVLLERYGQRPHTSPNSTKRERFNTKRISAQGLFGTALYRQGFLHLLHAYDDPRTLKEEQYWIGLDDDVILSAIGQQQGVLVLCFDPADKTQPTNSTRTITDEGNLLVCITLLSAYLFTNDKRVSPKGGNAASLRNRVPGLPASNRTLLLPPKNVGTDRVVTWQTSPMLEYLAELYEIKLKVAIDEERSRIARDIHDGAAQNIVHAIHKLELIQRVLEKQPENVGATLAVALREISRTSDILKESWHDLRHSISSLIPLQLEEQGFDAALQNLLHEHMHDEPGLKIDYERDDFVRLPLSLEVPIFRFIQEALNNVRKHAQASRVIIRIRLLADLLLVEVNDNGEGFDVEEILGTGRAGPVHHVGLRSMRDHVQDAGGQWKISSTSGEGTTVRARFLLPASSGVLTQRERDVLRLLVEGLTNRAIAEKLSVSTETIKSHVHHIMQKMQVNDRTQAAVIATKQHWL